MYSNFYLDLKKVSKLEFIEADRIYHFYDEMLTLEIDSEKGKSIFNTLIKSGYLKEMQKNEDLLKS